MVAQELDNTPLEAWLDWRSSGSLSSRDALIQHYLPLARGVAGRIYRGRADDTVPFDDYLQYARMGLVDSVNRFDPSRGAPFHAFALHRIRGSILNGLTQETEHAAQREATRRIARERRESLISQVSGAVQQATLNELIEMTVGLALGVLLDTDEPVDESCRANPYAATEVHQLTRLAWAAVERLPPRERDLIRAHYRSQVDFRDLAQQWSLTPGRISQLHARAIASLRQLLNTETRLNRRV